jgi:hypothetical protein
VIILLSGVVVVAFCFFLIGLALLIAIKPPRAERFLLSFASSAQAHFAEQGVRLLVGAAMVNLSRSMWYPELFKLFGWLIIATSLALLVIPWRWHQWFAMRVMPPVIERMWLLALGALVLASFILYGVSRNYA